MALERITVATEPPYSILVGAGALASVAESFHGSDAALLADRAVLERHSARLVGLRGLPRLELEGGEGAKTLARLGEVLEFLASAGLSRRSTLVTLGGGSISDLGGLAASLFKRGCAVVHAPTTLLAQVDAAIGGKTAINLAAGKNLVGTFHQPKAVFADTEVLATLPEEEFASGLGEVVKSALVGGEQALADLEARAGALAARDPEALATVVRACAAIKAAIVSSDPHEEGGRRVLNLGHTFAHAIEHAAGYGVVPHGIAVAVGLVLACEASRLAGILADVDLPARVRDLVGRLGLPTELAKLRRRYAVDLLPEELLAGLAHDKKGAVGRPEFVLPERVGAHFFRVPLDPSTLRAIWS